MHALSNSCNYFFILIYLVDDYWYIFYFTSTVSNYKGIHILSPNLWLGGTVLCSSVGKTSLYSFSTDFIPSLFSSGYFNSCTMQP